MRVLSYKSGSLEQLIAYKVSNNPENFLSEVRYLKGSVYVGLRGDDKVMVFKEKGEALEMHCSFKVGNFPRHLNVSEEGFVYVSCQKGDSAKVPVRGGQDPDAERDRSADSDSDGADRVMMSIAQISHIEHQEADEQVEQADGVERHEMFVRRDVARDELLGC